jgi:predicted deacylase
MTSRGTVLAGLVGLAAAVAGTLVTVPGGATAASVATTATAVRRPAVVEVRVIGHSVKGRPIRAYRVGDPKSRNKVVVMSTMHGNEPRTRFIPSSIRDGRPLTGIDLWLVPVVNPDGLARHTRRNAHGVDLNRNFPFHWARLGGSYYSGRHAASEPETRALMRFFADVRPRRIVSFHQPLHGVDVSTRESRTFAGRLASGLNLPRKNLTCGGVCHGTFTQWYMHRFPGVAVTVEYGSHPSQHRMTVTAPRQLLRVLGGRR